MPLVDYKCPFCDVVYTRLYNINQYPYPETIDCETFYCRDESLHAEKLPPLTANIQIGKPTIVFKNPLTGVAQVATSEFDQPPPGFIKEEIKGSIERSKFEKEQNLIASFQDDIYNESRMQDREILRKNIIEDATAHSSADAAKSDNPALTEHLMKKAIEHIRKKPSLKRKRKTEFRLDVNHLDKSNLT